MKKIVVLMVVGALMFSMIGCGKTPEPPAQSTEITVAVAPGPVSYPLAYMSENQSMKGHANSLLLKPWRTYDQLLSMVTSKQVQLVNSPLTNAIMMYNKGEKLRLLNVAVWGMLYVLSPDGSVKEIKDLKGKEVSVTGQGGIHDLVLRHLLIKNGLNPDKDVKFVYLDLPEASAKLATGEIKYAVLNEPNSSMAILNAAKGGVKLERVIDLQKEWGKLLGKAEGRIPQAGLFVLDDQNLKPEQVEQFVVKFEEASLWINEHPAEAGPLVEKHFENMKAPAVQESLKYARLNPARASACQQEVEEFFNELLETAPPEALGGKLPDAKFYY